MTTFNLTCEAVDASLDDYLDGSLEPWVRESIEEHLNECTRCAARARNLRSLEREASVLPALMPERDLWPEVAIDIGVPAVPAEPVIKSEPVIQSTEPPSAAEALLEENEPLIPTAESSLPAREPLLPLVAPLPPISHPLALATEPSPVESETVPPRLEPLLNERKTLVLPAEARLSATQPANEVLRRREKRLQRAWMGLAAAALVLVTAGSTFLLTVRWAGPLRTPYVVTDTVNRRLAAKVTPPVRRATGEASPVREPVESDSPSLTGALPSSLTAATTPAARDSRTPDEIVYDNEIRMLQAMRSRRTSDIDPAAAVVIEKNLRIIDSNIAQIRAALQKDPHSPLLDDQVSRALDMKVELLRRVAMLRSST